MEHLTTEQIEIALKLCEVLNLDDLSLAEEILTAC
jgi:hypothetical protein